MKKLYRPGWITLTLPRDGGRPPVVMTLRRPWVGVVLVLGIAFLAAAGFALAAYVHTMKRIAEYATLSVEVDDLRQQNARLQDLETELREILLFQEKMLHLAGVETALRQGQSPGDNWAGSFPPDSTAGTGILLVWPVTGERVTARGEHTGVDIAAVRGQTVMAAGGGKVVSVDPDLTGGFRMVLDHGDAVRTVYSNLEQKLVLPGDRVQAGQAIARVGPSLGGAEAHLHFEVWKGEMAVPPEDYMRRLMRD